VRLYDSMRRAVVPFEPLDSGRVTVYGCGPTVYDFAHVGNFRTFLAYDLLHRCLRAHGHAVEFVVNLTDVDDKTIEGAAAAAVSLAEHTAPFAQAFQDDAETLGMLPFSRLPRATDYVPVMIRFVERLLARGHAYAAADGSVYYSVSSFEGYGGLSGSRPADEGASRSRIDADDYQKGDARDFVLWKAARPSDHAACAVWDSPWGPGRPGWHLECSAMSTELLGDTIDVHLGGEDLLFPHHENEIAQSEAATGHPFARHWLHVKHLKVEGRKMSKSVGNFHTVRGLLDEGHEPAAIRWVLLSAHYRSELDFTRAGLEQAAASLQRLRDFRRRVRRAATSVMSAAAPPDLGERARRGLAAFLEAMADDLNVSRALAELWTLARDANGALDAAADTLAAESRDALLEALAGMDAVLGVLDLADPSRRSEGDSDEEIERLVHMRNEARARRDFAAADRLRDQLAAQGVRLEDAAGGTRWARVRRPRAPGPGGGV